MAEEQGTHVGGFSRRVHEFETAEPLVSHEAFEDYLDNLEALLAQAALMVYQDGELASTWLRNRKPKVGKRVPFLLRARLAARTRGHSRHAKDALHDASNRVKQMRAVHAEFVQKEMAAAESGDDDGHEEEQDDE